MRLLVGCGFAITLLWLISTMQVSELRPGDSAPASWGLQDDEAFVVVLNTDACLSCGLDEVWRSLRHRGEGAARRLVVVVPGNGGHARGPVLECLRRERVDGEVRYSRGRAIGGRAPVFYLVVDGRVERVGSEMRTVVG